MANSSGKSIHKKVAKDIVNHWPYLLFILFVVTYNWLYLGQGYSAPMDEGYLQSLAARIIDGQLPYKDFYFLRTPVSLYIQAMLIGILGKAYTLFSARIFLTIELALLTILLSFCYKQFVRSGVLFLLLTISYSVITLLLNFPWYSYDAVFFASVALFLMHNKRYFLTGAAIFLSAMSKQNYLLLLPLLPAITVFTTKRSADSINVRQLVLKVLLGFAIPAIVYTGYLLATDSFLAFFRNVFVLPAETSEVTWQFALFQDNLKAMETALPVVTGIALVFLGLRRSKLSVLSGIVMLIIFHGRVLGEISDFVYTMIFVNYASILLWTFTQPTGHSEQNELCEKRLMPLLLNGLVVQYLSGFNYGGLLFAQMGAGIAFPFAYVSLEKNLHRMGQKWLGPLFIILILGLTLSHKYKFTYHEALRPNLRESFDTPMLNHITSTAKNVFHVNSMIAAVETHTQEEDYIFVYSDYPAIYYLTNRRNPTPIQWYYRLEFNKRMFAEAMDSLETRLPQLMLIHVDSIPERLGAITSKYYSEIDPVVGIRAFVLTKTEDYR